MTPLETLLTEKRQQYAQILDEMKALDDKKNQLLTTGVELQGAVKALEELQAKTIQVVTP